MKKITSTLFLLIIIVKFSLAQSGTLDPTFGSGGIFLSNGAPYGQPLGMAIQPDNKIVVLGNYSNFLMLRLNTDGSYDNSFGTGGQVLSPVAGSGWAVAIQSDSNIVVAGFNNSTQASVVARHLTNGNLDNTFGTSGKVVTKVGGNCSSKAVAIQSDGKILAAGMTSTGGTDMMVLRYNTNGTLDSTFDNDGIVTTALGFSYDYANSVSQQPDGKIVVAGSAGNSTFDFAVVRYNSNGSLDSTFGVNGKVATDFNNSDDQGYGMKLQSDGKIVVAGTSSANGNYAFAIARYNTDGTLDNNFGTNGKTITGAPGHNWYCNAVDIQQDGKIIAVGRSPFASANEMFTTVRYDSTGILDNAFGTGGIVFTDLTSADDYANGVAVQNDGQILVVGQARYQTYWQYAVVRFNGDMAGINDYGLQSNSFLISPNPASDNFNITFNETLKSGIKNINIFDLTGRSVFQQVLNKNKTENFRCKFPPGIYLVQISDGEKVFNQKLIIK